MKRVGYGRICVQIKGKKGCCNIYENGGKQGIRKREKIVQILEWVVMFPNFRKKLTS